MLEKAYSCVVLISSAVQYFVLDLHVKKKICLKVSVRKTVLSVTITRLIESMFREPHLNIQDVKVGLLFVAFRITSNLSVVK